METTYRSLPEFIVKTDDIEHISNRACDNLKLGDEVILVSGDEQKKFIISSKSLEEMKLAFITSEEVTEVIYKKADDRWSYDETITTPINSLSPEQADELKTLLPSAGSKGKVPFVNDDEDGYEFKDISSCCTVSWDSTTVSLEDFIASCNAHLFADTMIGKILTFSKLINGASFRMIVIGHEHDVLANTDNGELEPNGTTANLTLQFYDMPFQKVNLALPYEEEKEGYIRSSQTEENMEDSGASQVTIDPIYPSNAHGYASAVGLIHAMQEIFNSLPTILQQAIKTVRKDIFISEIDDGDNYEMFDTTSTVILKEQDRYGSCVNVKLFCLSASEMGMTHSNAENDPDQFPYDIEVEIDEVPTLVNLEGKKYAYFDSTPQNNQTEQARNKRIRYYKGEPYWYWLRSPYLLDTDCWGFCDNGGYVTDDLTSNNGGVAPAFAI